MTPAADAAVCQCGHSASRHVEAKFWKATPCQDCTCLDHVADVNRPDDDDLCPCGHTYAVCPIHFLQVRPIGEAVDRMLAAAVPDREVDPLDASGSDEHVDAQHALGATEQLAALFAAHRKSGNGCECGWVYPYLQVTNARGTYSAFNAEAHDRHHAAVIVAAGWTRP